VSSYDEAAREQETQQQQEKGPEAFLSQDERQQLRRNLSFPEEFPREFGSWIEDYMGTHGNFQKSQVQGLPRLFTQVQEQVEALEDVVASIAVIGTTYTDEPGTTLQTTFNGDEKITGASVSVPAGRYFCIFTTTATWAAGAVQATVRLFWTDSGGSSPFGSTSAVSLPSSGSFGSLISIGSITLDSPSAINGYHRQDGNGAIDFSLMSLIALRTA
jgi:hypothetical protein